MSEKSSADIEDSHSHTSEIEVAQSSSKPLGLISKVLRNPDKLSALLYLAGDNFMTLAGVFSSSGKAFGSPVRFGAGMLGVFAGALLIKYGDRKTEKKDGFEDPQDQVTLGRILKGGPKNYPWEWWAGLSIAQSLALIGSGIASAKSEGSARPGETFCGVMATAALAIILLVAEKEKNSPAFEGVSKTEAKSETTPLSDTGSIQVKSSHSEVLGLTGSIGRKINATINSIGVYIKETGYKISGHIQKNPNVAASNALIAAHIVYFAEAVILRDLMTVGCAATYFAADVILRRSSKRVQQLGGPS